ncbi:hypothetical protein I204_06296 [Kwoniella mangroviensis CBS 8886]|uniref:uncharacterized protein n=1 Tax=Kwoniella mangroviensis CBS 8507 TaxID=1296122 RepID=UPI00080CEAB2|nr:uncharacterized protein I203_06433 [Kwoniella mangroviensis CBS 8507]OCF64252.1 hypothetical protein I203_06433 [Kwoniella mangroviensis CBS 8507]OCF73066.1 hypothetical protein I204_06296 [Kwoniella mangroviensis CBS 8886]
MTPSHFADSVWEGYYYQDMVITNRGGRIDNLTTCTQAFAFHTFDETAQEPGLESPRYEGSQYTPPSRPKPNVPLNPVPRVYQELDKVITARWEGKGGEQDGNLTKKPPIKRMPGKVFCENRFCALELPTTEDKQLTAVLAYSEEDRTNDTQRSFRRRRQAEEEREPNLRKRRSFEDLFHSDRRGLGKGNSVI